MNWQPIETAPTDGSLIIVSSVEGVWLAKYKPVFQSGYVPQNPWQSFLLNNNHVEPPLTSWKPTHWMPLPTPPKDES